MANEPNAEQPKPDDTSQKPADEAPAGPRDAPAPTPAPAPATREAPRGVLPSGDGASIDPAAEENIWTGRANWKHYLLRVLLWAVVSLATIVLCWMGARGDKLAGSVAFWIAAGVVVIFGVIIWGGIFAVIIGNRYRVTTQRIFIEKGIFSQTVDQTELIRVDDVRVHKTVVDRICGLGSIEVMSTDATHSSLMIAGVKDPDDIAEAIRVNMRKLRKSSLFVESL